MLNFGQHVLTSDTNACQLCEWCMSRHAMLNEPRRPYVSNYAQVGSAQHVQLHMILFDHLALT